MFRRCLSVLVLVTLTGCSGSKATLPDTVAASGAITLDGQPASFALITFVPRNGTKGIECMGVAGPKGDYKMKQIRGKDGVPPGEYTVVINRYVKPDGTPVSTDGSEAPANLGAVESLPSHYSNPGESILTATVPATGGAFNFELKSR